MTDEPSFADDLCALFPEFEDTILTFQKFQGPRPDPTPIKFTLRQKIRIWRTRRREAVEQWIHDHLQHAHCDC